MIRRDFRSYVIYLYFLVSDTIDIRYCFLQGGRFMKKILRNLTIVLLVSMMIGTTCFAAEGDPQIYVDGVTIPDG